MGSPILQTQTLHPANKCALILRGCRMSVNWSVNLGPPRRPIHTRNTENTDLFSAIYFRHNNSTVLIRLTLHLVVWSPCHVIYFRFGHSQTWCRGARETNRPHGEDCRRHRGHPPLCHHIFRSHSAHEEKVGICIFSGNAERKKNMNLIVEFPQTPSFSFLILYIPPLKHFYCQHPGK